MQKQNILLYTILFIIIIGTSILLGVIKVEQKIPLKHEDLLKQGKNINIKQFDRSGEIKYIIDAKSFQDLTPKKTIIQEPNAIFYNKKHLPAWHIKSDTGYIYNKNHKTKETLTLTKNVILTKKVQDKNSTKLITDNLNFFTNNEIAYTQYPVTITEENTTNKTTANGLIYSNYLQHFYLLANVKTHYQPKKDNKKIPSN
jgi:LPS export ABC transporter protein LptC